MFDGTMCELRICASLFTMQRIYSPVTVPCTTVPFLSSMVTLSLLSFIKKLCVRKDSMEVMLASGAWPDSIQPGLFKSSSQSAAWHSRAPLRKCTSTTRALESCRSNLRTSQQPRSCTTSRKATLIGLYQQHITYLPNEMHLVREREPAEIELARRKSWRARLQGRWRRAAPMGGR